MYTARGAILRSNMFDTHKLNEVGFTKVKEFKTMLSLAISEVMSMLPESEDKDIFRQKVEEAVFFGTRSIACDPSNYTEIIPYPEKNREIK